MNLLIERCSVVQEGESGIPVEETKQFIDTHFIERGERKLSICETFSIKHQKYGEKRDS